MAGRGDGPVAGASSAAIGRLASTEAWRTAALTFFPLPGSFLRGPRPGHYLTTPDERARLLRELTVELVITLPFDERLRATRAAGFVDLLVDRLDLREIWVGQGFALGYQREGDVAFLRAQGDVKGFAVHTVQTLTIDGVPVSSSRIRRCIQEGSIEEANRWLGRPFRLPGTVVMGDGRGRQIGFPTANLQVWEGHACPARGVYAGRASVRGSSYPAAINIGLRPTLTAGEETVIEAHLAGFSGDLAGQELAPEFLARIRDEKRFGGVEELVDQLYRDVATARRLAGQ